MVKLGHWPDRLIAETERLYIVVPTGSFAKRMMDYALRNYEYHRHAMPTPQEEWNKRTWWHRKLQSRLSNYKYRRAYGFVLLLKDNPDGKIIGDCTFSQVFHGPLQAAVLGYKMDEKFAGKGYMLEALNALLQFMFSGVGLHRVEANVRPQNARSYHLLRRLGFVLEGFSKSYLELDGRWEDHLRLALLNPSHGDAPGTHLDLAKLGVTVPEDSQETQE